MFDIDNIVEKLVCAVFYIYIVDLITHFHFMLLNKLFLILGYEMAINIFILLDILSDNSIYLQLSIMQWQLIKKKEIYRSFVLYKLFV